MNYIRACFCIDRFLDLATLREIGKFLETKRFRAVSEPQLLDSIHWYEQSLVWQLPDANVMARFIQIPHDSLPSMISLDIDASFFLSGTKLSYYPKNDGNFKAYTQLLFYFINQIKPYIGLVDYDADLLCTDLSSNSFKAWGNYLSNQFLSTWNLQQIREIERLVDEYHPIDQTGILTFNHPLGYGQPRGEQIQFWKMVESSLPSPH